MEATIEVTGLRKRFGPATALDGMTFTVSPGQITGFVGPNGAGKSTTMRVILGLDVPDAGTALVGGRPYTSLPRPLNGMDPEGIVWMRGFLRSLAARDRAVLISSHLMSELQDIADHLVIVGRGKVIADTSTATLLAAASHGRVTVRTIAPDAAGKVLARAGAEVAETSPGALLVSGLPAERIVVLLSGNAVPFSEVAAHRASLEQAYLDLTCDAVEYRAQEAG